MVDGDLITLSFSGSVPDAYLDPTLRWREREEKSSVTFLSSCR